VYSSHWRDSVSNASAVRKSASRSGRTIERRAGFSDHSSRRSTVQSACFPVAKLTKTHVEDLGVAWAGAATISPRVPRRLPAIEGKAYGTGKANGGSKRTGRQNGTEEAGQAFIFFLGTDYAYTHRYLGTHHYMHPTVFHARKDPTVRRGTLRAWVG
jgi:hypothetical protein